MPFGKYRGEEIQDLPDNYLYWLMTIDLHGGLKVAVERELDRRENPDGFVYNPELSDELHPFVESIIESGYRSLAMNHHPDCGGNTEDMQLLNRARQWLRYHVGLE